MCVLYISSSSIDDDDDDDDDDVVVESDRVITLSGSLSLSL